MTKVSQNSVRLFVTLFLENVLIGSPYPTLLLFNVKKKKCLMSQKDEFSHQDLPTQGKERSDPQSCPLVCTLTP